MDGRGCGVRHGVAAAETVGCCRAHYGVGFETRDVALPHESVCAHHAAVGELGLQLGRREIVGHGRDRVVGELDLAPGIAACREQDFRAAEGALQLGLVVLEPVPGQVGERRARIDARDFELLEDLPA